MQTALVKVYLRSRHMAPEDAERYVRRAIINANLSRFRRHRVRESLVDVTPDRPEAQPVESGLDQAEGVRELLAGLSRRQRAVLGLRYGADLSEAEVADGPLVNVSG